VSKPSDGASGITVLPAEITDLEPDEIEEPTPRPRGFGSLNPSRFGEDDGRYDATDEGELRRFARHGRERLRRQRDEHTRRIRLQTAARRPTAPQRPRSQIRNRADSGPRTVSHSGSRRSASSQSGGSRASPSGDPDEADADALARLVAGQADAFAFSFAAFNAEIQRHDPEAPPQLRLAVFTRLPSYLQRRAWRGLSAQMEAERWS
jgi:hypothetical protein